MVKKTHTCKWLLITDRNKRILFSSAIHPGHIHDFAIFKSIFSGLDFSRLTLWVDSGFLGIDKQVKTENLFIPFKASKHHPLDDVAKEYNSIISSVRVRIEHAIANLKSFFILRIRNRIRRVKVLDSIFDVCTRLANFKIKLLKINT